MFIKHILDGVRFPVDFNKIEKIEIGDGFIKIFRKGLQVGTFSLELFEQRAKFVITQENK